jgi:hypothetical protein
MGTEATMIDKDDPAVRTWVETWKRAGPELEAVGDAELRAYRYEDHAAEIDALLEIAFRFCQPRPTSGLVEQQRLFGILRERKAI